MSAAVPLPIWGVREITSHTVLQCVRQERLPLHKLRTWLSCQLLSLPVYRKQLSSGSRKGVHLRTLTLARRLSTETVLSLNQRALMRSQFLDKLPPHPKLPTTLRWSEIILLVTTSRKYPHPLSLSKHAWKFLPLPRVSFSLWEHHRYRSSMNRALKRVLWIVAYNANGIGDKHSEVLEFILRFTSLLRNAPDTGETDPIAQLHVLMY